MPYYENPTYTIENGILTIPNDCIQTIVDQTYFSFSIPGSGVNILDNPIIIKKNSRDTLEKLASILGLSKAQIQDMKKKELIDYLIPHIVFDCNI